LKNKPESINLKYLEKYPQYVEFKNQLKKNQDNKKEDHLTTETKISDDISPIDLIES